MRVVGLTAGGLELAVGIPLAYATAINLGRFSLFALAPIFSLLLVVLFLWPNMWSRLTETKEKDQLGEASALQGAPADSAAD